MILRRLAASVALALCGTGAAWSQAVVPGSGVPGSGGPIFERESGRASWYGEPFHGRKTASGEVFDMGAMTAAHKTLPFGTRVLVVNLDNGRRVVVRVNDRGPFVAGRIIDLSKAAGALIGLDASGTARVEIRPAPEGAGLGSHPASPGVAAKARSPTSPVTSPATLPVAPGARVRIQVASFRDEANAREAVESLRRLGLEPVIEAAGAYRRVVLYALASDRKGLEEKLEAAGWKDRLVSEIRG